MQESTYTMVEIERAYELGRAAERQKMADLASITSNQSLAGLTSAVSPTLPERMRARHAAAAATVAPKAPKAPTIARGVKRAAGPRTRGVRSAITALITTGPITVDGIIARTGFKKNSIVSTLMDLKKKGLAMQDDKAWVSMTDASNGGNSETGAYAGS